MTQIAARMRREREADDPADRRTVQFDDSSTGRPSHTHDSLKQRASAGLEQISSSRGSSAMSISSKQSSSSQPIGSSVRVQLPRAFEGPWAEAYELARANVEPIFVPVKPFADERGWSLMNLLNGALSAQGQINFSMQYPGVVKAWHRHQKQTDFWCCVHGHLKAGVFRESDGAAWMIVMGQMRPGVLIIPTPLWHGATCVGSEPAGLLYYVTQAYDPANPDEQRRPWDSVEGFPWAVRNG